MATVWNEDEHATFAVNLGYMSVETVNEWLAKRDGSVGRDKPLAPLLLEEGAITQPQYDMMMQLMGQAPEASVEGNKDYDLYMECKQAARHGDVDRCEVLLGEIQDPDYKYRAEIQTMKAQNAREQFDKEDE